MICGQDPPFPSATYARLLFCQGLRLLSEAAKKLRRENYSFLFGVRAPPPTPLSFLLPLSSLLLLSTPSSPFSFSSSSLLLLRAGASTFGFFRDVRYARSTGRSFLKYMVVRCGGKARTCLFLSLRKVRTCCAKN